MAANGTGFVFLGIMVVSWRNRRTSATLSLAWPARSVLQQIRKTMGDPKKGQHVAALLPFVLPVKLLTINDVADVADFPDLCIVSCFFASILCFCLPFLPFPFRWLILYSSRGGKRRKAVTCYGSVALFVRFLAVFSGIGMETL